MERGAGGFSGNLRLVDPGAGRLPVSSIPAALYNGAMSIRSWLEKRRQRADAEAIRRAEEEAVESAEERARGATDRWGQGADNRFAGRIGERPEDVNRLGDFNP
jgi:hypothetical protein